MTSADAPSVSIIISTLDRARLLQDSLRAIEALDYANLEVVVVNGPSTDDTAQVLDRWEGRLKRASCPVANLAVSRNLGIERAAGELIAFIDDDAAAHPAWLKNLVLGFGDPRVGAVGGCTIDNTGVRWQVRKTICDRFGNVFNVAPHFDERPLCRPGSPYYPSLLGTNCAFRASALRRIGGFDEVFAYLLDETDVCLRLVDAGWVVTYEPSSMVFHQFAPSGTRSHDNVARTLYPSAVSKAYFTMTHGARRSSLEAATELDNYRRDILGANAWLYENDRITEAHRFSLDQDLLSGIEQGVAIAMAKVDKPPPTLRADDVFQPMERPDRLHLAFVSQAYEPRAEAGIARWTSLAAHGLAARGHTVHVLTRADGAESVEFHDGLWVHRMTPFPEAAAAISEAYDIPTDLAAWCGRVWREVQLLKSSGLRLVSFPIWDLEGLPLADDGDLATVVSLHTTYAMAKPFKPEWNLRPLFEYETVNRIINAEARLLASAPVLLSNSKAIEREIKHVYGLDIEDRALCVPHGTTDPLESRGERAEARDQRLRAGGPLRVLFVGRFEPRKGFDIATRVAACLVAGESNVEMWFAGDTLSDQHRLALSRAGLEWIEHHPAVRFLGVVSRAALDDAYVDCDLVLAPSRFESFGLVAIEAMAAGRPVFALAAGGLAEIVEDHVSGRLWADSGDVAEPIAAEIQRLNDDRDALLALGRGARKTFEQNYTAAAMAEGLERAYRRALSTDASEMQP